MVASPITGAHHRDFDHSLKASPHAFRSAAISLVPSAPLPRSMKISIAGVVVNAGKNIRARERFAGYLESKKTGSYQAPKERSDGEFCDLVMFDFTAILSK